MSGSNTAHWLNFLQQFFQVWRRVPIYDQFNRLYQVFEAYGLSIIVEAFCTKNYTVTPTNLINGAFRIKLYTQGYQSNFSYFWVEKGEVRLEIRNNLQIFTFFSYHRTPRTQLYITPDIAIVRSASLIDDYYVKVSDLIAFGECKNFAPFPEVLVTFEGLVKRCFHACKYDRNCKLGLKNRIKTAIFFSLGATSRNITNYISKLNSPRSAISIYTNINPSNRNIIRQTITDYASTLP